MHKVARKLVVFLTITALSLISQINPAKAATPFSQPTSISSSMNLVAVIPSDDQKSVLIWRDGSASPNPLRSSILHLDGTVTDTSLVYTPGSSNERVDFSRQNAWTRLPDGTLAITWTTFDDSTFLSTMQVAYSDTGSNWTQPVLAGGPYIINPSLDCTMGCGYRDAQIASDGMGNLALQSSLALYGEVVFRVQMLDGGNTWSQPFQLGPVSDYTFGSTIIGQPAGGFINSWISALQGSSTRFVSSTSGSQVSAWSEPKSISTVYQVNNGGVLLQTGPKEFAVVYVANYNEVDRYAAVVSRFSTVTKTWSSEQLIMVTGEADYLTSDIAATVASDGTVGVAMMSGIESQSSATLSFNTFKGMVIGTKSTPIVANELSTFLSSLSANKNGTFNAVYTGVNAGVKLVTFGKLTTPANLSLPFANGSFSETAVGTTVNGNVFTVAVSGSQGQFIALTRATSPTFTGTPGMKGKAKIGTSLVAKAITFSGIAGFGPTSYQWFSCSRAVPANTLLKPNTCVAIPKATSAKFKVTAKQKGKYVTVETKSKNDVGETHVFAPSLTKIK